MQVTRMGPKRNKIIKIIIKNLGISETMVIATRDRGQQYQTTSRFYLSHPHQIATRMVILYSNNMTVVPLCIGHFKLT